MSHSSHITQFIRLGSYFDFVSQVAFGIDLNTIHEPDSPFPTAIRESLAAPIWCLIHPLHAIDFTSYGYQNTVVAAIHFLRDTGKKIIDERRKAIRNGDEVPSDILTYILKSVREDTSVDYEELLDHFVTFFIAGEFVTPTSLMLQYIYILLDGLVCSIVGYFYESCRILAIPLRASQNTRDE